MSHDHLREELGPAKWKQLQHKLRMNGKKAKRKSFSSDATEAVKIAFKTETKKDGTTHQVPYEKECFVSNRKREAVPDWRVVFTKKRRRQSTQSATRFRRRMNFKAAMQGNPAEKAAAHASYLLKCFKQRVVEADLRRHGLTWRAAEIEARKTGKAVLAVAQAVVAALEDGKGKQKEATA